MTKNEIADVMATYIHNEMLPNVPDVSTKMMLGTIGIALKRNPGVLDVIVDNPIIYAIVCTEDGYDMTGLLDTLTESIKQYGNLKVSIPKIPLIMPSEQSISFTVSDVEKLKQYMR